VITFQETPKLQDN